MSFFTWEMAFPIGAALLGLAVAWGFFRYKTRNKANDQITDEATRAEYSDPAGYQAKEEGFRDRLKD